MKSKRRITNEFAAGCARVSGGCIAYHGALRYYALQTLQFNTIYLPADAIPPFRHRRDIL